MRLLLDENPSFRLVRALGDVYPGTVHVREAGLLGAEDQRIWHYAAEHRLLLTSKDTDFYERSMVLGAPPKVIWLRIGNSTVAETAELLRSRYLLVQRFVQDPTASFLSLRAT